MPEQYFNAFVAGSSGVFKGICAVEKCDLVVKNLDSLKSVTNKNPITSMNWGEGLEEEILLGYGSQLVKIYNLNSKTFTLNEEKKGGEGAIVGIAKTNGTLITAVESGVVKFWKDDGDPSQIDAGGNLDRMRHSVQYSSIIATGGKENDLKLWDIVAGKNIFTAKNVRHDNLEMRVPVWVTDVAFILSSRKVAVTTKHGHVRLYDPSTCTRRPVVSVQIPEQALTCIACSSKDHHVIVGSGSGQMNLVDLRSKGLVMNKYKGFVGGIKAIACSEEEPYIASVSLDRHFRIHHLTTKELLYKVLIFGILDKQMISIHVTISHDWGLRSLLALFTSSPAPIGKNIIQLVEYMQSKLTCVLVRANFDLTEPKGSDFEEGVEETESKKEVKTSTDSSSDEYEELFQNMPTVGEKRPKSTNMSRKKVKT